MCNRENRKVIWCSYLEIGVLVSFYNKITIHTTRKETIMYQYLLFDLDGTLTDSKPGIINCIRYALDYMQYTDYNDTFLNQFVGPPLMVSFQQFCGFSEENATLATGKYRERFATTGIFENAAYNGAVGLSETLKAAGNTMALATSNPEG